MDEFEKLAYENTIAVLESTISTLAAENDAFRNRTVDGEVEVLRGRIEKLNETIDFLIADNKRNVESGNYYRQIQDAIAGDEMLQDAWKDFVTVLKLRMPGIVPGLTGPDIK